MSTRVVHCKKEPYDIYIGRDYGNLKNIGWGNPYIVGIDGDRGQCVPKYETYIMCSTELLKRIPELRGKTLGCWCKPNLCHGDILVKLANLSDDELNDLINGVRGRQLGI